MLAGVKGEVFQLKFKLKREIQEVGLDKIN